MRPWVFELLAIEPGLLMATGCLSVYVAVVAGGYLIVRWPVECIEAYDQLNAFVERLDGE